MAHTSRTLLLLSFAFTGCFYPADRGKMMEARMARLEASRQETEAELARQRERIEKEIRAQVQEVQSALDKLDRAARRTGADMGVQLEQMQGDLNALRGQIEQYLHRITELEAALTLVKDAQAKAATAEAAAPKEEPKKEVERPADKKAFAELVATTLASDAVTGRKLASEWLKKWPKDPLAAKVYYELGNAYFHEKNWRAALGEFKEIFESFGRSEHAPQALLRSSECFANLKMQEEARLALETIVANYAKTDAAKVAKERLAALKKSGGKKKK